MTGPRKIVRVITRMNIGGPSVHVLLLSTGMDAARFSTCLVMGEVDASEGDASVRLPPLPLRRVKALVRPIRPWADVVALAELVRILWAERPQVLHTHLAKAGALGRMAGMLYNRIGPGRRPDARAVLIHTFHGHVLDGYFSPWVARVFVAIERWLARRTDVLVAVSATIRDELLQKGIGRADQWRVVPLGIDLSSLAQLPAANGSSEVRLGMVGRLVPIKNPHLFLEALHRLGRPDAGTTVQGVIVGDGPLRIELERAAGRLGLDGRVRFVGWQHDLRSVYEGLEVACVTSWNEGTPVALIEAMAAGRAVVSTDVGGVRDLLGEEGAGPRSIEPGTFHVTSRGILVRPGDVDGLAAALRAVSTDTALRVGLAGAARAYVLPRFGRERLLRDITALYESVQRGRRA